MRNPSGFSTLLQLKMSDSIGTLCDSVALYAAPSIAPCKCTARSGRLPVERGHHHAPGVVIAEHCNKVAASWRGWRHHRRYGTAQAVENNRNLPELNEYKSVVTAPAPPARHSADCPGTARIHRARRTYLSNDRVGTQAADTPLTGTLNEPSTPRARGSTIELSSGNRGNGEGNAPSHERSTSHRCVVGGSRYTRTGAREPITYVLSLKILTCTSERAAFCAAPVPPACHPARAPAGRVAVAQCVQVVAHNRVI